MVRVSCWVILILTDRIDPYVCGLNLPNALCRSLGNWCFENVAAAAGVDCDRIFCCGAVMADVRGAGYPDLYVSNY